jgi:drug/metabolite transporter (DMT)-like permease
MLRGVVVGGMFAVGAGSLLVVLVGGLVEGESPSEATGNVLIAAGFVGIVSAVAAGRGAVRGAPTQAALAAVVQALVAAGVLAWWLASDFWTGTAHASLSTAVLLAVIGLDALTLYWALRPARDERDVLAATTVALVLSALLFAPVAAATWDVDAAAVPWIAASAVLEIVYFVLLTTAYRRSDLTLVYPVARGSAPVLVLAGAAVAGATIGRGQALGVLLVGGGILLVRGLVGETDARGLVLALGIGATIAGYTLVDKEGVEHAAVIPYFELVLAPAAVAALVWHAAAGRLPSVRAEMGWATLAASVFAFAAYALVLAALTLASAPAVAAVRETSVLFAVALGASVLGEPVRRSRAAGAVLVVAGVALVALG